MNKAIKRKKDWFWAALIMTLLGVAAIPGIVFSAGARLYFVMAICIALAGDLLYGVPLYWIAFGGAATNVTLVRAVREQGLITVGDISHYMLKSASETRGLIMRCISKGYLDGMLLKNDTLTATDKQFINEKSDCCSYCGGMLDKNSLTCPHCGAPKR